MDQTQFKKANKPGACLSLPFEYLIPYAIRIETILKIKQESIDAYGYDLTGECPKRLVCAQKQCIGRPLPFKSPTALPYLKELAKSQKIVKEELFIKTNCNGCPIFNKCSSPCQQVNEFINRSSIQEPYINYKEDLSTIEMFDVNDENYESFLPEDAKDEIPWDILTSKELTIVKYRHMGKDFNHISEDENLKLYNEKDAKYAYYAALTKLAEYAIMRKFIEKGQEKGKLTFKQYQILSKVYLDNKKPSKVAKELKISQAAVTQIISRIIETNKITWPRFVRKEGKSNHQRIIYNIPERLK
jgi:hypothetical protein